MEGKGWGSEEQEGGECAGLHGACGECENDIDERSDGSKDFLRAKFTSRSHGLRTFGIIVIMSQCVSIN